MSSSNEKKLMYQQYSSILNPGFWQQLTDIKLNKLKLSKEPIFIHGSYSCNLSDTLPCLASFDHSSFNELVESSNRSQCHLRGELICTNTMQEFLDLNKKEFLDGHGSKIWESICDGRALNDPERHLSRFGLIVFADLKRYKFVYWFAFPALNYPREAFQICDPGSMNQEHDGITSCSLSSIFSEEAIEKLQREYDKPCDQRSFQRGYFIVKHTTKSSNDSDDVATYSLSQYRDAIGSKSDTENSTVYFAFTDPAPTKTYPGWPLRNYLALIAVQYKLDHVKIIRIRKGQQNARKTELQHSFILDVRYDNEAKEESPGGMLGKLPLVTGWEKNESQQMAPKRVNLSSLLDPRKLAEDAVNLNLRLMKWRLLPSLDLDKIASTRCLILGCGTLGCHVSRGLLAWGIKSISIVDNARVSFSNPARQSLYVFDDCSKSNSTFKAEAAAASLRRVHPSVDVSAHVLSIPMPGHHIVDKEIEQTRKDVSTLENLIDSHDAIFLLMDTRESRWLPTVIAMSKQKLVINAAIGFDTFLLQRYGIRNYSDFSGEQFLSSSKSSSSIPSNELQPSSSQHREVCSQLPSEKLGCYFCNDIVAPGDSTIDRTLDQQCTVSRPGVSMMVSAMAVELLVSIVSNRMGSMTPAPIDLPSDSMGDDDCGGELGIVPHSIRGNLSRYHIYMPTSPCFNKCSACSPAVVNAYRISGYEFLQRVFDDPSYLEDIAGLKDLQVVSDNVWALDSDEEVDNIGDGPSNESA